MPPHKPAKLYKFQPFTTQSLTNLKSRTIWFGPPSAFNDPFDCAIRMDRRERSNQDYRRVWEHLSQTGESEDLRKAFGARGWESAAFQQQTDQAIASAFDDRLNENLNDRGISCFCEIRDNPLLWAHYADGHRGFCLEFDTSHEPFSKLHQVSYSDVVPEFDPIDDVTSDEAKSLVSMLTTKAQHWAYEQEWRVLHGEAGTEYIYPWQALTGLYFGVSMSPQHQEIISLVLSGSPTQLYQGHRDDRSFAIDFQAIDYTPFPYVLDKDKAT